jgi:DNA-binding response OmpR family regulator
MADQKKAALLISPVEHDHEILGCLFEEQGWTLFSERSIGPALTFLHDKIVSIVITERDLPVGDWRDVLEIVDLLPDRPQLIVTSLHADDRLWVEALNLGAHDVLAKPFDRTEVVRSLNSAWARCKRALLPGPKRVEARLHRVAEAQARLAHQGDERKTRTVGVSPID